VSCPVLEEPAENPWVTAKLLFLFVFGNIFQNVLEYNAKSKKRKIKVISIKHLKKAYKKPGNIKCLLSVYVHPTVYLQL